MTARRVCTALVCQAAQHTTCRCRCGGTAHGVRRSAWTGYYCEGCDKWLGWSSPWEVDGLVVSWEK